MRRPALDSATRVPAAVSDNSSVRPSLCDFARRTRPRDTRRATTVDTLLWWVWVSEASLFKEIAGASTSVCRTNSWAPLRPTVLSAERDDSRKLCTIRRTASRTMRVSDRADVLDPIYLLYARTASNCKVASATRTKQ